MDRPPRGAPGWLLVAGLLLAAAAGRAGAQPYTVIVNSTTYHVKYLLGTYADAGRFEMQPWFTGSTSITTGDPGTLAAAAFAGSSVEVDGM